MYLIVPKLCGLDKKIQELHTVAIMQKAFGFSRKAIVTAMVNLSIEARVLKQHVCRT